MTKGKLKIEIKAGRMETGTATTAGSCFTEEQIKKGMAQAKKALESQKTRPQFRAMKSPLLPPGTIVILYSHDQQETIEKLGFK